MKPIIIVVNGGVAEVVQKPKGVKVIKYDYDGDNEAEPCLADFFQEDEEIDEFDPDGTEPIEEVEG